MHYKPKLVRADSELVHEGLRGGKGEEDLAPSFGKVIGLSGSMEQVSSSLSEEAFPLDLCHK